MLLELLVAHEAERDLREDRDILGRAQQRGLALVLAQPVEHARQRARQRGQQAQHQLLAIAAPGLRREPARVRPQVLEPQIELGRIVALGAKREGLGEDALEAMAGVALEAHLARVERVAEAIARAEPLDPELEARDAGAARSSPQRTGCFGFSPDS